MKVKFISGDEITFDLQENTIIEIRNKIAEYKNSVLENVRLIYMGKVLKDEDTFEMHKLTLESVLTAVVKKTVLKKEDTPQTEHIPPSEPISPSEPIPHTSSTTPSTEQNNPTAGTPFNNQNTESIFTSMFGNPEMRNTLINLSLQRMGLPNDHPFRSMLENNLNVLNQNPNMINPMMQGMNADPNMINQMMQGMTADPNMINQMMQGMTADPNMINQMMQGHGINMPNPTNMPDLNMQNPTNMQQSTDNIFEPPVTQTTENNLSTGLSVPLEPEVNLEELRSKYSSELEEIKNMGFEDEDMVLKTLAQSHGSVVITINKLFS